MTHMRLYANKFEHFEYNHSAPKLDVGLSTDHFYRIVKTVTNDDTITFSVSKAESNHLTITLENGEKSGFDYKQAWAKIAHDHVPGAMEAKYGGKYPTD